MIASSSGDYTLWAAWLDDFGNAIDHDMADLPPFSSDWGEGMYGRLLDRVERAFTARMDRWQQAIQRDLSSGRLDSGRLGAALAAARRRLQPVRRFAGAPHFPEDLRERLREALRSSVDSMQQSLERSAAESDPSGRAAAVIRGGSLLADLDRPAPPSDPRGAPPPDAPPRRTILFR